MESPEAKRARADLSMHVADLREIPLSELVLDFAPADLMALNEYQAGMSAESFATQPVSEEFAAKYPDTAGKLGDNLSTYDDEVEDSIFTDELIVDLTKLRRDSPSDIGLATALRARRSVLALLDIAGKS